LLAKSGSEISACNIFAISLMVHTCNAYRAPQWQLTFNLSVHMRAHGAHSSFFATNLSVCLFMPDRRAFARAAQLMQKALALRSAFTMATIKPSQAAAALHEFAKVLPSRPTR
jgi:hypothetical protein